MFKKPLLVYLFTALVVLGFVGWHMIVGISSSNPGSFYNKDNNATWIRHSWVDTDYSWEEISELVHGFEENGIRHVYVHSGPVDADGLVPEYRYVFADRFVDRAKAVNPNISYYAWLGQKRSKIDLDDESVRKEVIEVSRMFVEEMGYDGIHYDFEAINGYDEGFKSLVVEFDEKLPEVPLSIAVEEYIPGYIAWGMSFFKEIKDLSSGELMKDIAGHVDQYVVMSYDTDAQSAVFYTWLVKQEVIAISRLLPESKVWIGVPTYDDQRPGFNAEAENITSGMQGVIDGMNSSRTVNEAIEGVAIYANWETDSNEWNTYKSMWLE